MNRPTYTDTFESRTTRHDECESKVRRLLTDAGLDPFPSEPGSLVDIKTRTSWGGRSLFEVKIARSDGTVAVSGRCWQNYPREQIWFVIGRHADAEPVLIISGPELQDLRGQREDLPSGDWGWRFPRPAARKYVERLAELEATGFLRPAEEATGKRRCNWCRFVLPEAKFDRHRDRGFQANCRVCDHELNRLNRWWRERGLSKFLAVRALADIQRDRCPCGQPLALFQARLRWNETTGEHLGFTHDRCPWKGDPSIRAANSGVPHYLVPEPDQLTLGAV